MTSNTPVTMATKSSVNLQQSLVAFIIKISFSCWNRSNLWKGSKIETTLKLQWSSVCFSLNAQSTVWVLLSLLGVHHGVTASSCCCHRSIILCLVSGRCRSAHRLVFTRGRPRLQASPGPGWHVNVIPHPERRERHQNYLQIGSHHSVGKTPAARCSCSFSKKKSVREHLKVMDASSSR